ncbi:hypothetical protein Ahy_B01g056499 [Arachis hypogaea]|uniref:Uncharacterized protein n=1 Tax=Arachis hypogaea TaxID=3818 RepID=A0A445AYZ4_ARAHY|nr:hypothetical protein Ahy_B01g056499 [Arachis hypogaea]
MVLQEKFIWDRTQNLMIRKIFDYRMARRLQQMLEDVREHHDHLTICLHPNIKKALYVHWETYERFKHHCLTNRANTASARSSKHTDGLATFMKTKVRLSKSLDHDATMAETFKYTHMLKENKEKFVGQWAADYYRLKVATHQSQHIGDDGNNSAASVVDPDMVWRDATSEPYKNHVYGLGSFFGDNLHTSILRQSSASDTIRPVDPEDGVNLREQVLLFTWSLHQQAQ